ncbi:MAG: FAD-binding oxidoreductase [Beijerinckiaceae bacterium]
MTTIIESFLADLGDIPVATDPGTLKLKSRDFFWFSPILKPLLDDKRAKAIVRPRNREELIRVVALAAKRRIALTTRGGGTGNYGQCVPLDGGVVLDVTGLDRILEARPGLVTVEAGKLMLDIDRELKPTGWELRVFPSTRAAATIGGFICGGAAGAGSITWGQIGDAGAVQAMTLLSMEETPRVFTLEGPDTMKAVHAYGVNGIVLDVTLPTAPRQDWAEALVTFPTLVAAARFGQLLAEDQIIAKKLISIHAPGISRYFKRILPFAPEDRALAVVMVSEPQLSALAVHASAYGGEVTYTRNANAAEASAFEGADPIPPLYEYCWNHTTLRAINVDPVMTYLQVLFPMGRNIEALEWAEKEFAGEILWHLEFQKRYQGFTNSSLPLVRFTTPERLNEIMAKLDAHGLKVSNPHIHTLEGTGWKRIKADQEGLKREADPHFLLNPGRLPSLEQGRTVEGTALAAT